MRLVEDIIRKKGSENRLIPRRQESFLMQHLLKRLKYWSILVLLLLAGCQPLADFSNALSNLFSGLVNSIRFPEFPSFR
jgi:hypothetical protein